MQLNLENLKNISQWQEKGYILPKFDIQKITINTKENPTWIHFGAGNLFKAFPALVYQQLLNKGLVDTGIIVCETFDTEIISKSFTPYNNLSITVTLKSNGTIEKEILGSIVEALIPQDMDRLIEIFVNPSLQIVSMTVTEKGYSLVNHLGEFSPFIQQDFNNFRSPKSPIGLLTYLLYQRFLKGKAPIALVSLDNCSHNGTLLQQAILTFAKQWQESVGIEFIQYLSDDKIVSFTWSMIDKITPRPDENIKKILENDGISGITITQTSKNTYISPFVNAEESQYLAIEDNFPNGRPLLEKVGILFSDRETIDKIEKMKVCTCLNPLHTVLAIFGCLLDYTSIAQEMKNPHLVTLIKKIGYDEGLPVVVDPKILNPKKFIDEVIEKRFPNPFVPDTPQRIACDTSLKLPIRFGETIKAYLNNSPDKVINLKYIPLVFAAWLRYLMGINDKGIYFKCSPDPKLDMCQKFIKDISLGDTNISSIKLLLQDHNIFGVDLYKVGLGEKVEMYFLELIKSPGSVRKILEKYCQ